MQDKTENQQNPHETSENPLINSLREIFRANQQGGKPALPTAIVAHVIWQLARRLAFETLQACPLGTEALKQKLDRSNPRDAHLLHQITLLGCLQEWLEMCDPLTRLLACSGNGSAMPSEAVEHIQQWLPTSPIPLDQAAKDSALFNQLMDATHTEILAMHKEAGTEVGTGNINQDQAIRIQNFVAEWRKSHNFPGTPASTPSA